MKKIKVVVLVYPACAGIHLKPVRKFAHIHGLPRMRGDPPVTGTVTETGDKSTPHARGSTLLQTGRVKYDEVYPACAGIHRITHLRTPTR